jgi:hypothetical protein
MINIYSGNLSIKQVLTELGRNRQTYSNSRRLKTPAFNSG